MCEGKSYKKSFIFFHQSKILLTLKNKKKFVKLYDLFKFTNNVIENELIKI